jgi:hypothetical protein
LNPLPSPEPVTAAVAAATYSRLPRNATIQTARRNRMVTRYSTPSGHGGDDDE